MKSINYLFSLSVVLFLITQLPTHLYNQTPYGISIESKWPYGPILSFDYSGDLVYYGSGSVLMIYDVKDTDSPVKVKERELESYPVGILIDGNFLYLTLEQYGLYIYDNSNPRNPIFVGKYENDRFDPRFVKNGNHDYCRDF